MESQREHLQLAILHTKLRRRIIDVFVNSVYVYEDKLVFTYNFRDGNETVSLLDIERAIGSESSDLTDSASPEKPHLRRVFSVIFALRRVIFSMKVISAMPVIFRCAEFGANIPIKETMIHSARAAQMRKKIRCSAKGALFSVSPKGGVSFLVTRRSRTRLEVKKRFKQLLAAGLGGKSFDSAGEPTMSFGVTH